MNLRLSIVAAILLTLFSCDSERVQKIKEKVKQSADKVTSTSEEKTVDKLFDEEEAKKFIASQLPKIVTPVEYEFEAEKIENEKFGEYVSIKYLLEVSYNDEYYNVDKSTSFMQILKEKGWTNEFAQLKKSPYTFFNKVTDKGETTAIKGALLYRLSGERMAFKDHTFEAGRIAQGYPLDKFKEGFLMIGSKEADDAIDTFMATYEVAKRHKDNVMRTIKTGKQFKGTISINSQLRKSITVKMLKHHEMLKATEAQIIFDENPELKINLKGTYITEIRPANRSNINYKVDSINLYNSPSDPFFQKIHPIIKKEYFNLFLAPSGNLSGKSKNLSIDLSPDSGLVTKQ